MTEDTVSGTLIPLAAELVACVRDFGPDDVAAVLARVPDGRHDALAVVLAAMVDPDARPSELLNWLSRGPVESRDKTPHHLTLAQISAVSDGRRSERRGEVARLSAMGLPATEIARRLGITPRAVTRHRRAIRETLAEAL